MKLQFDPNQAYQHDAIAAVTDLFDGQPLGQSEYSVIDMGHYADYGLFAGQSRTELGVGNNLVLGHGRVAPFGCSCGFYDGQRDSAVSEWGFGPVSCGWKHRIYWPARPASQDPGVPDRTG